MFELLEDQIERQKQRPSLRTTIVFAMVFAFLAGLQVAVLIFKIKHGGDWASASIHSAVGLIFAVLFGKDALRRTRQLK